MRFLLGKTATAGIEYIVVGAIALIVIAASIWTMAKGVEGEASDTRTSIEALDGYPTWP